MPFSGVLLGLHSKYARNPAYSRLRRVNGGQFVLSDSVEKARWQRDLLRFLHLRKRFVLSNKTWHLEIDGTLPGQIMTAPLPKPSPAALKHAGGNLGACFFGAEYARANVT